jgi:hypothetical protein
MGSDEITNAAEEASEPTGSEQPSAELTEPAAEPTEKQGWSRRAFFQAAALGAAATAFLDAKRFMPSIAWANDLSDSPCTAQDVEIIGTGIVVNEPCTCTGTFNAVVQFTVRNNTNTGRYCVALHLVPDGTVITTATDLILRDASGSSTALPGETVMFATIPNFSCSVGQVCFGSAGVTRGKCAPGTCSTIAWSTSPNAAGCATADQSPPGGQCRHQQICIQGYGASLLCSGTSCSNGSNSCTVACGASTTLRACVSGGTPGYSYHLTGTDGTNVTFPTSGRTNNTSTTFNVSPTQNTTYTLTVTDSAGCSRSATASLTTSVPTVSLALANTLSTAACNTGGTSISFKATPSTGCTSPTYTWKVGTTTQSETSDTFAYPNNADGNAHTVSVTVTCGGCTSQPATKTITQCIHTAVS